MQLQPDQHARLLTALRAVACKESLWTAAEDGAAVVMPGKEAGIAIRMSLPGLELPPAAFGAIDTKELLKVLGSSKTPPALAWQDGNLVIKSSAVRASLPALAADRLPLDWSAPVRAKATMDLSALAVKEVRGLTYQPPTLFVQDGKLSGGCAATGDAVLVLGRISQQARALPLPPIVCVAAGRLFKKAAYAVKVSKRAVLLASGTLEIRCDRIEDQDNRVLAAIVEWYDARSRQGNRVDVVGLKKLRLTADEVELQWAKGRVRQGNREYKIRPCDLPPVRIDGDRLTRALRYFKGDAPVRAVLSVVNSHPVLDLESPAVWCRLKAVRA